MLLHNHPECVSCACGYNVVNYDAKSLKNDAKSLHAQNHARKLTIFLLLPRPYYFCVRLHLPRVHFGLVPDFHAPIYPRWRSQRSRLAPKYARPAH